MPDINNITGRETSSETRLLLGAEEGGDVITGGGGKRPREPWKGVGEYAKSMVYAGLDAIITCFSLISSISATQSSTVDVLVLGLANLVADGISMGLGDFVSSSTEEEVDAMERAVTKWDVANNHARSQKMELVQQYQALGLDVNDATTVVEIFAKYDDILVNEMMRTQKGGMLAPFQGEKKPWKNGLTTFVAFIAFGSLPLLSFIVLIPFTNNDSIKFIAACIMAALALALLGIAKAKIAAQSYVHSLLITLCNGAVAATAAYGLSWMLRNVAGLKD